MESVVDAPSGRYRGVHVDGVHSFLGIRYGRLALGRLRPGERLPRESETIDCLAYGPVALQYDARMTPAATSAGVASLYFAHGGQQAEGRPMAEDCLTLNVWTPDADAGASLPVIVWIHGGAFRAGGSTATVTYGADLAARGRAIVVGITHRLGLTGFLGLGHLLGDDYAQSGVAGITDLVLGLEWVAENIAAFGGDPARVTIMGQSGGGAKVSALLSTPSARGLFSRAIAMSAAGVERSPEVALAETAAILRAIGVDDARDLIHWPASRIRDAQVHVSALGMGPVLIPDGEFVDESRRDELAEGIPLLVGHTSHDWSFFVGDEPWFAAADATPLELLLTEHGGDASLAAAYRTAFPDETTGLLYARVMTDASFGAIAAQLADGHAAGGRPTYRYEFAYETEAWHTPLGATHCVEVPFVFDTVAWSRIAGDRPERFALARAVGDAWLSFAECGEPTAPGLPWPRYAGPDGTVMRIDAGAWTPVGARFPATA